MKLGPLVSIVAIVGLGWGGYVVWQKGVRSEARAEAAFAKGVFPIPFATTRGHVQNGMLQPGHTAFSYEVVGDMPGMNGAKPARDIMIVVHGLNNDETKAVNRFGLARESLQHDGYSGMVVGFSWDGSTNWDPFGATGYREAKHNAFANGPKLARFVEDLHKANPGAAIRLLGYSMGARLVAESILALDKLNVPFKVTSVHLVGAAIDDEQLQTNEMYGKAIERHAGEFYNYFSPEDSKLGKYYPPMEADRAVGRHDLEEPEFAPANFHSRNVAVELKEVNANGDVDPNAAPGRNHSAYLGIRTDAGKWVDDGAMNVVAEDILKRPGH